MRGTAIRAAGGTVLVATLVLLVIVVFDLVASAFVADPLSRASEGVPLSEVELILLVLLLFGLVPLTVFFWLQGRPAEGPRYNTEE